MFLQTASYDFEIKESKNISGMLEVRVYNNSKVGLLNDILMVSKNRPFFTAIEEMEEFARKLEDK
jgi:hypothetical protein